jgi:hypothetical protein
MAMMAMTTNSSIKVNPFRLESRRRDIGTGSIADLK